MLFTPKEEGALFLTFFALVSITACKEFPIYYPVFVTSISFSRKHAIYSGLLSIEWKYVSHLKAISNDSDDL